MYRVRRIILRFAAIWIIEGLSLGLTAAIAPGISITPATVRWLILPDVAVAVDPSGVIMSAALLLGLMNVSIRPVLLLLTLPINTATLGATTLIINALLLWLTSWIVPGFEITSLVAAVAGTLVLAAVNTLITSFTTIDDDDSFFQGVVERISKHQRIKGAAEPGRGIVMLELDGLSYDRIKRAIEKGTMPTVREMIDKDGYVLSPIDCGLPSQTSACQAGIMYGDNYDIPAFRWYDKDQGKLFVSNNAADAAAIDARFSSGRGLLRGGSSVGNLTSGDAEKSLLTFSTLNTSDETVNRLRADDLRLFFINPYLFPRTVALTLWDILVELWQALRQKLRNVQPRINRLEKAYPIIRGVTSVVLRDICTYVVSLDVIRGVPAIYTTYLAYDEVAHHAGPDTPDAFMTLRQLDGQIRRVRDIIARKAGRPYDLFVLSDHGQSFGATFRQRYGYELKDFIKKHLAHGTTVAHTSGHDVGASFTGALVEELKNMNEQSVTSRVGKATVGRAQTALQRRVDASVPAAPAAMDADVLVFASGNLANVYFSLRSGKISIDELNAAHPRLVDTLVEHEGVGFVVGHDDEGAPIVLGKQGARNLRTGTVTGADPLARYGDVDLRAKQLLRLAEFPHAGDLIVNSTVYEGQAVNGDLTVAAFEEQIGSHGGLGGQQTDAFLLHPGDMQPPSTSNSTDIFAILNTRRGLPGTADRPQPQPAPAIDAWTPTHLWKGIRDWRTWTVRALHAALLSRSAHHDIADDPYATGPALVVLLLAFVTFWLANGLQATTPVQEHPVVSVAVFAAGWIVALFGIHGAARLLGGKGQLIQTFRVVAFAAILNIVALLGFIPAAGPVFRIAALLLRFFAAWIGLQEAHHLQGGRAFLLPIVAILVLAVSIVALRAMAGAAVFTLEAILDLLGIVPEV
ncbi:MAG TPA: phage holin family protein [Anaerolineae bacterium]|nr:phage holin family protein [Anaerolineae bacterium]